MSQVIGVYVGKSGRENFEVGIASGTWGWRQRWSEPEGLQVGDLIAISQGGGGRLQLDEWLTRTANSLALGKITRTYYESNDPLWPDEIRGEVSYPHRVGFDLIAAGSEIPFADIPLQLNQQLQSSATKSGRGFLTRLSDEERVAVIATLSGNPRLATVTRTQPAAKPDTPQTPGPSQPSRPAVLAPPIPPPRSLQEVVGAFDSAVRQSGLRYSAELVRLFLTSLATKRFLIITGLSGSGKTRIAQAFGEWLGASQHLIVAVRPDWTSPDALLGYENGLSDPDENGHHAWNAPEALQFMLRASADQDRPYLLVLDEMNLAHVERYFADVLSGMESGHPVLPKLARGENGWRVADPNRPRIPLPTNLFVVGTVNVDETTYMFSPKVLDRANTIEFRVGSEDLLTGAAEPRPIAPGETALQRSFLEHARRPSGRSEGADQLAGWLRRLHQVLSQHDREFGHRVFQEALRFADLFATAGEPDPLAALDVQVLQKVLPKFHGSIREINDPLNALGAWAFHGPDTPSTGDFDPLDPPDGEPALPRSYDKIRRMTRRLRANHFVSFTE